MKNKFSAVFALVVGIGMIAMWLFFIFTGNVPEIQTKPWEITLHLAAEFLTAILLVISSVSLFCRQRFAKGLMLLANGMLAYTVIVSPGYYAQSGDIAFVVMFGAILCLDALSTVMLLKD